MAQDADLLGICTDHCRVRQRRLLDIMQANQIDMVVLSTIEHIQYFIGPKFAWTFQPAASIDADGKVTLVAPERRMPKEHAADEVVPYEAQWHSTLRNDQRRESTQILQRTVPGIQKAKHVGVEFSTFSRYFELSSSARLYDLEPDLFRLRRAKDADELAKIEKAISATGLMYERARQIIEPGVNELEVFNQLQSVAVQEFGEMLTGTGNDYQCGSRGGAPRDRECQAGELYILDLGPAFRGYFADNARTVAVTSVNDHQQTAWDFIQKAFAHVESEVKPGKSCRKLFEEVQGILDECPVGVFNHHLGHGIGLFPHEGPHLNPNWDDQFQVGDVFTAEPGLYNSELNIGMRLENDYLVTEDGVRNLTDFPLELKLM